MILVLKVTKLTPSLSDDLDSIPTDHHFYINLSVDLLKSD
jgi:hypothetical protein